VAKELPSRPNLEQLKRQAKELVDRCARGDDAEALRVVTSLSPHHRATPSAGGGLELSLSDSQFVIARDYGFASWPQLKHYVESLASPSRLAWIGAIMSADLGALEQMLASDSSLANTLHREFEDPFRKKRFPVASLLYAVAGPPPQMISRASVASRTDPAVAKLLLKCGADPNVYSHHGRPLCWVRDRAMAELLIAHGGEINLWHDNGGSPLNFAIWGRCSIDHIAMMIDLGADPNQAGDDGSTILHEAARFAEADKISLLVESGARPTARNQNGETPLDVANRNKRPPDVCTPLAL
jgi:hypothetical protein